MASFISQHQGNNYDVVKPYEPDFSWMSGVLQTKETQYEKGLSEISSGYSAIVNAPITNFFNKEKRKEYLQAAQEGLKKITTQDLSKDKNVRQAEALYAPFWEDEYMLMDAAQTKSDQKELETLDSWKRSTDKTIRAQYSDYAVAWIQDGQEELAMAERTPEAFKKLKKRVAVPFADIDADMDADFKANGNKPIETIDRQGNVIVTQMNGPGSKDAYRAYWLQKAGDKYDQQLYITQAVRINRAKKEILASNPGMNKQAVDDHFAAEQMSHLNKIYTDNIEAYNNLVQDWSRKYNAMYTQIMAQGNNMSQSDQATLEYYQKMIIQNHNIADQYRNEYEKYGSGDSYTEKYQKTLQEIKEHPEDYLSSIQKGIMAENWANRMASMNTSTKIEVDPGWKAYMEEADKAADRTLKQREIDATNRGQTLGWMKETGRDLQGNIIPGFRPDQGGWSTDKGDGAGSKDIPNPLSGTSKGYDYIDPAHTTRTVDKYTETQEQNVQRIQNGIYDYNGVAGALEGGGLSPNDIVTFTKWAKSDKGYATPDEIEVVAKVKKILNDKGINTEGINGPRGMESALLAYTPIGLSELRKSDNTKVKERAAQIMVNYLNVKGDRDKVLANKKVLDANIQTKIAENPGEYDKIVHKGTSTLITNKEMVPDFPSLIVKLPNGTVKTISPTEGATMWAEGTFMNNIDAKKGIQLIGVDNKRIGDYKHWLPRSNQNELYKELKKRLYGEHIITDPQGNQYKIIGGSRGPGGEVPVTAESIVGKYGMPGYMDKKRYELTRKATENITKPTGLEDGLISASQGWDPGKPTQKRFAEEVSTELVNNTDLAKAFVVGQEPSKKLETVDGILKIIGSADDMAKYTSGPSQTILPDGTPALSYTIKENLPSDNEKSLSMQQHSGKTFVFPAVPKGNATPALSSIPWNNGQYIHSDLLYSSNVIKSDPTMEASGVRYMINPQNKVNGKNTSCIITIQKYMPLPQGGNDWVTTEVSREPIPLLVGPNAKTPDEVVKWANGKIVSEMYMNVSKAQIKQQSVAAGTPIQSR